MKDKVLADTSVWIEFFKAKSEIGSEIESLLKGNHLWTCGVVMFELLQGIKSDSEKKSILEILSAIPYIEMKPFLWEKSAAIASSLKRKGITLPLSDIFIASIAIEHNLSILTLDKHFEQIPNLKIYK